MIKDPVLLPSAYVPIDPVNGIMWEKTTPHKTAMFDHCEYIILYKEPDFMNTTARPVYQVWEFFLSAWSDCKSYNEMMHLANQGYRTRVLFDPPEILQGFNK